MAESQGPTANVVSIVFGCITFFVICLRMFARIYVVGKVGIDDSMCFGERLMFGALLTTNSSHGDCIGQLDLRIHFQYTSNLN